MGEKAEVLRRRRHRRMQAPPSGGELGYNVEEVKAQLKLASRETVHELVRTGRIRLAVDPVTGEELRGRTGTGRGSIFDRQSVDAERMRRIQEAQNRLKALSGVD